MSKMKTEKWKSALDKKELDTLTNWIKSDGTETVRQIFEKKSEVEKLVERMSVVDVNTLREPYTI